MDKIRAAPTVIKLAVFGGYAYVMSVACTGKNYFGGIMGPGTDNPTIFDSLSVPTGDKYTGDNPTVTLKNPQDPDGTVTANLYVKAPGSGNFANIGAMAANGNDLEKVINLTKGGTYKVYAEMSDGINTTKTAEIGIIAYLKNSEAIQAVVDAINEIGVNASTTNRGEIKAMNYPEINYANSGVDGEVRIDIYCRGPPFFRGIYLIDVQGNPTDIDTLTKKPVLNALTGSDQAGYLFITKITNKNHAKQQVLQEKNETTPHNWPQLTPY